MKYAFHSYTDAFSIIYDRRWGRYASSRAPILISFLENRFGFAPGETRVCDLCCGTGQLTHKLADHGYRVHSVDQSPGMIALCRRNNQEFIDRGIVEVSQQRAQEYHLPAPMDVTVALFDSLNHLPSMSDLRDTFRSAAVATIPGGLLLFDLNTRLGLDRWNGIQVDENEAWLVVVRGVYSPEMPRAYTAVSGFVDDNGNWRRFSEVIYNTPFVLSEVQDALERAGWGSVQFFSPDHLSIIEDNPEEFGRVFVAATRNEDS